MRARSIQLDGSLELALRLGIRMIVEVELPEGLVKFRLVGTQLQGRLIFLDSVIEVLAKGESFCTQLVGTPGFGRRVLQLRISLRAQHLVGSLQPIARFG